jgi:hypothetical protein
MSNLALGKIHYGSYFGVVFSLFREFSDDDDYYLVLDVASADGDKHHIRRVERISDVEFMDAEYDGKAVSRIKNLVHSYLDMHPLNGEDLLQ